MQKLLKLVITITILWLGFSLVSFADNSLYPIYQRIKPVFSVNVEKQSAAASTGAASANIVTTTSAPTSGADIYQAHCSICHSTGAAGAPKLGDATDWNLRIKQGEAILIQHALSGYKIMPPKGGCGDCTDDQIKSAVEYMIQQNQTQLEKDIHAN